MFGPIVKVVSRNVVPRDLKCNLEKDEKTLHNAHKKKEERKKKMMVKKAEKVPFHRSFIQRKDNSIFYTITLYRVIDHL